VGPPGSNVRELTLQLSDHFEAVVVSVGDLLKKEVSKKTEIGHRIDEYIRNMLYAPDSLVVQVLRDHIAGLDKTKNIIIEGFPKTLYQSMAIIQEKILPDLLLVVNYSEDQCHTFLKYGRANAGASSTTPTTKCGPRSASPKEAPAAATTSRSTSCSLALTPATSTSSRPRTRTTSSKSTAPGSPCSTTWL
jgi:hypothetical protein